MPHLHTLARTLAAALVIVALAASPASARPGGSPGHPMAAGSQYVQDRLDGGTAAGETGRIYWSYDYEAPVPKPKRSLRTDEGDTPSTAAAAGLAGVGLLVGAAAAFAVRARRGRVVA